MMESLVLIKRSVMGHSDVPAFFARDIFALADWQSLENRHGTLGPRIGAM
jgi:hypothetical protein